MSHLISKHITHPSVCGALEVIDVEDIRALVVELAPDGISGADGPAGLVPVASQNALTVSDGDLRSEESQLSRVQRFGAYLTKLRGERDTGDWRHAGGNVGKCRVEGCKRAVEEVVALADTLDLVQWSVASSDDCDWARGHCRAVHGGQVAKVTKGLESLDDVWPGGRTIGLDIDEEVESLGTDCVVHAVLGCASNEWRGWVLALEDVDKWIDVE